MKKSSLLVGLLLAAAPGSVAAQSVEIVFTPAVVQQAVALKSSIKADKVESFGALALVGAAPAKKKEYADRVARLTALVIIGEDALKATSDMEFACPVIVVNATGLSPGSRKVVRVFDPAVAPPSAKSLSPTAITEAVGSNGMLKGDVGAAIQALVGLLR